MSEENLNLKAVIGFGGRVPAGLKIHPDGRNIIYPLGSTVVVRDFFSKEPKQKFLQGHSDRVSCIEISPSGRYLASGQVTYMGFKADLIIWDYENACILHRLKLARGEGAHSVKVQSLAFSSDEKYLASLGGEDDNKLIIWDVETGEPICGTPAGRDPSRCVAFFHQNSHKLVTAGVSQVCIWNFDRANRKLKPTVADVGLLVREVKSITIDPNDDWLYCGTATGDVLQLNLRADGKLKRYGPKGKEALSSGIGCTALTPDNRIVIGAADGTIALLQGLEKGSFRVVKSTKLLGGVTSISHFDANHFIVGTDKSNMYHFAYTEFEKPTLIATCHSERINDVCFPNDFGQLFATCSLNDIRIWHARTYSELLRIQVPNLECLCIEFTKNGDAIVSGWSDGRIRAFGPQSGRLLYTIEDAHDPNAGGVTAIATTYDEPGMPRRIISGGADGRVRVWRIGENSQVMLESKREHRGKINCICVRFDNKEMISASNDGSCIVWSLEKYNLVASLNASTFFKTCVYNATADQLLTCGTDRKISYWHATKGASLIRETLTESANNSLDVVATPFENDERGDGDLFVSGGNDRLVKVWNYNAAECYYKGVGHSATVTKVKVTPGMWQGPGSKVIISVGEEGAVMIWELPYPKLED